jgi:hypothetical protein
MMLKRLKLNALNALIWSGGCWATILKKIDAFSTESIDFLRIFISTESEMLSA